MQIQAVIILSIIGEMLKVYYLSSRKNTILAQCLVLVP